MYCDGIKKDLNFYGIGQLSMLKYILESIKKNVK